ncbi:DUF1150 family protein [Primorskyibacter aestuariivivens]|uniref:DUF1150 family protein n=1 Tax=Primorskyibacter aestuariivivens TaxID=1888912 RepID=UPI002300F698|nr:DUF1150 family protein [Primorskyibacter aestuariivivens]MDA7428164.1 DUF1150 family protein [Primorskyibacter aestuariivivens]
MNTKYDFGPDLERATPQNIVYVKSVAVADLPIEVQNQAAGAQTLYAVHREDGEQIALVADRRLAYVLARQHDMSPVAVH